MRERETQSLVDRAAFAIIEAALMHSSDTPGIAAIYARYALDAVTGAIKAEALREVADSWRGETCTPDDILTDLRARAARQDPS